MRIGIDLGGTKIEGIVLETNGRIAARRRVATPQTSYAAIIASLSELVVELETEAGQRCTVGVGMPGILSPHTDLVKNSNTTVLNGRPLDRDLAAALERDIRFENDANCFALSEALDGAGQGYRCIFGVIIGTGTGGGIVMDQHVVRGANRIAGEWGHNPLPWPSAEELDGPRCYCGKRGCLETYLCGAGLRRAFAAGEHDAPDATHIALRASTGDRASTAALQIYADRLARGLASVVNIVDPDVIVLGGGLSNISALYGLLPTLLRQYVFTDHLDTPVLAAQHGDSSGVRGAARLWPQQD